MFRIQARHKCGYYANSMIVHAENANEAIKSSRLSDFQDQWRFSVTEIKTHRPHAQQNH